MSAHLPTATAEHPPTERKPVTDEYHGEKITDDYRWMEDGDSPAVKAWTAAQNQHTRAYLDALSDRSAIQQQLTAWFAKDSPSYGGLTPRPGRLFALKFQPPKQQRLLVVLADRLPAVGLVAGRAQRVERERVASRDGHLLLQQAAEDALLLGVELGEVRHGSDRTDPVTRGR